MRDNKRLEAIRKLPCVQCGMMPPSEACHANWAEFGKGMGIKADDQYTIPLCRKCHFALDTYSMSRDESKAWFMQMLDKTNRMLNFCNCELF